MSAIEKIRHAETPTALADAIAEYAREREAAARAELRAELAGEVERLTLFAPEARTMAEAAESMRMRAVALIEKS